MAAADSKVLAIVKQLPASQIGLKRIELKIVFLVKRFYTGKDLIEEHFGRLFYLPSILAEMGHECTVFALDFKNKQESDVGINNVRFRAIPVKSLWRLPLLRKTLRELRASNADIVFSSGDSYVGYMGLRLARRLSAKAVFDIYDDYSYFGSNKIPFMQTLLKIATSQSDLVTCASESIEEKYGAYQQNTLLVQNGVDDRVFRPEEKHSVRQRSNIPATSIVVGYLGSIHKPRGADDLIAAVRLLRTRGQEITLLMAGLDLGEVNLDYPWIDYRGMVDQREVVDLINACDVVTIPYKDTELIRMTNACKLMEYIACRVPVVVSDVSDYASYFPENFDCVSKPADPESLANAIANQLKNKNIVGEDRVLTWDELAARLEGGIKALTTRSI